MRRIRFSFNVFFCQADITEDAGKKVVQVMGNAAGKNAKTFKPLGSLKHFFRTHALGNERVIIFPLREKGSSWSDAMQDSIEKPRYGIGL